MTGCRTTAASQNLMYNFRDESKEEKKLLKEKSEGNETTKQLGTFLVFFLGGGGGVVNPPNGVKGVGVDCQKISDFHDFLMSREAISDLFSS